MEAAFGGLIPSWNDLINAFIEVREDPENPRAVANLGKCLYVVGALNIALTMPAFTKMRERMMHSQPILLVFPVFTFVSGLAAVLIGLFLIEKPNPRHAQHLLVKVTRWAINLATVFSTVVTLAWLSSA